MTPAPSAPQHRSAVLIAALLAASITGSCAGPSTEVSQDVGSADAPLLGSEWEHAFEHWTYEVRSITDTDRYTGINGDDSSWLVGDFDGDGDDDLVRRTSDGSYNRLLFFGTDNHFHGVAPSWRTAGATYAPVADTFVGVNGHGVRYSWHVLDVNGDGRSDLVRRDRDSLSGSKVLVSTYSDDGATGHFEVVHGPDSLMGEDGPRFTYLAGDFDGDGRDDLVRRDRDGSLNRLLLSRGDGTFDVLSPPLTTSAIDHLEGSNAGTSFRWLVGDFDGDGRADLCRRSADGTGNELLLSHQSSTGHFSFLHIPDTDGFAWVQPHAEWFVGDLDGDGRTDLIRRHSNPQYHQQGFSTGVGFSFWAPRYADGSFEREDADSWHVGDFDGDRRADVFGRTQAGPDVALFSRSEPGGHRYVSKPWAPSPDPIATSFTDEHFTWLVGDVNGDGMDDMILRHEDADTSHANRVDLSLSSVQHILFYDGVAPFDGASPPPNYARFRIPSIVSSNTGVLLAFAEGRVAPSGETNPACIGNSSTSDDVGDIDVVLRRSTDGGLSWEGLRLVLDAGCETVGNPTAVVDQNSGRVWLFVSENSGHLSSSGVVPRGARRVWITWSDDDGESWAPAVHRSGWAPDAELGEQGYQDRHIGAGCTPTATDEFCVPSTASAYSSDALSIHTYFDESSDPWKWSGTHWPYDSIGPGVGIHAGRGGGSGFLLVPAMGRNLVLNNPSAASTPADWRIELLDASHGNEGAIVELSTGTVVRNDRPGYDAGGESSRMVSTDSTGGWSAFQPDSALPDASPSGCQGSLLRVIDMRGDRILFMNPPGEGGNRQDLTVRISYDDHASWTYSRLVSEGHNVGPGMLRGGYSSMAVARPGTVAALHEAKCISPTCSSPQDAIVLRLFNLAWITGGEPDEP